MDPDDLTLPVDAPPRPVARDLTSVSLIAVGVTGIIGTLVVVCLPAAIIAGFVMVAAVGVVVGLG